MKTAAFKKKLQKINLTYLVIGILLAAVLVVRAALPGMVKNYVN